MARLPRRVAAGAQQAVLQLLGVAAELRRDHEVRACADRARRSRTARPCGPGRAAIMTTRLDRNTASWIECVTKITVSFFLRHRSSRSASSLWRVISSSAPKGSSISSRSGCVTRPRAIDTRICMPPDSARGSALGELVEAHQRQRLGHARIGLRARHAGQVERQPHVGLHAGPGHQRGRLEHEGHACGRSRRSAPPACATPAGGRRSAPAGRPPSSAACSCRSPKGPSSVTNSPSAMVRSTGSSACVPFG